MGGITEQGDTEGTVRFHDFLFKSVQILGPTSGSDSAGVRELKLTLTCERKREVGVGVERKGGVRE